MRRCLFYHTDLGQNLFLFALFKTYNSAVFHNFARQIALIQARASSAQQIIALTTL